MSEAIRTKEYLLNVTSNVLVGSPLALPSDINLDKLLKLAKKNAISAILYSAIGDKFDGELANKLSKDYKMSVVRNAEQELEIQRIQKDFTDNNIDFILLKGTHLKKLYPTPELRFMVDMDVLVRSKDKEKAMEIIASHGLKKKMESDKDVAFIKEPFLTVEVHRSLFHPKNDFYKSFLDVWEKAEKISDNEYKMSDNDLYVYTLAHLCEHYLEAGSLFRPCMDLYLLTKNCELDFEYINSRFEEMGILKFANNILALTKCMFEGAEKDETLELMENYVVFGAPVKNAEEASRLAIANDSKLKRLVTKLFPNYKSMVLRYETLKTLPFLLPVFWIIRIVNITFSKDKKINQKKNDLINADKKSADIMSEIFKKSGLK